MRLMRRARTSIYWVSNRQIALCAPQTSGVYPQTLEKLGTIGEAKPFVAYNGLDKL